MSDDLVKRLRSPTEHEAWLWSVPYQAADRIEKLEMLLHGEKCLRQDLKDTAEAHSKQQRDRIEKLEAALREIAEMTEGYGRSSELLVGIKLVAENVLEGER